jgi:pimeloyl-ACP methyl ester carboxylesterase
MDALGLDQAAVVGWSDGAIVALILAMEDPERVSRVFAFGANMDVAGLRPIGALASTRAAAERLEAADYAQISPTPGGFAAISGAVRRLQLGQPNYLAADLGAIRGPAIDIADADHEEFVHRRHTEYLARTIPGAQLQILPGASHFAPLQVPSEFNQAVLDFLGP